MSSRKTKLAEWRGAILQGTTIFGIATIGLIWTGAFLFLATQRESVERNATQNAAKLARAFEENIIRSVKETDAALLFLRAAYERDPANFSIADWVGGRNYRNDLALQLSIVDTRGFVSQIAVFGPDGAVQSLRKGVGAETPNVSEREHFKVHVDAAGDEAFLSKPIVGKTTGKTSILMTRRIRGPNNAFGGVVAAAIDPAYFGRFYRSIDIGQEGTIAVVGTDGVVRAQAGYKSNIVGKSFLGTRPFARIQTRPSGHFIGGGGMDGVRRLVAYQYVDQLPLVVTVALSEAEVFAEYRQQRRYYYAGAAALTVVILIVVSMGIVRAQHLAQAGSLVDLQNRRFDAALNNMTHGLCMFDASGKLVVHNARYVEMFNMPEGFIRPGVHIDAIVRYFSNGQFRNADQYTAEVRAALAAGKGYQAEREMCDGRTILVNNVPLPEGGWVVTHEDITAQKANERSLKAALQKAEQAGEEVKSWNAKLDAAIENMHQGLLMIGGDRKILVVNEQYIRMYGLSPEIVKPGCDLLDLFRHRAETGHLKMKPEDYLDHILGLVADGRTAAMTTHMADGRIIAVVNRPMADGSWVATHEDITERRQHEDKIAHMAHYDSLTDLQTVNC